LQKQKCPLLLAKGVISQEIAMLFYVVGKIVFWEFIYREHDDRPQALDVAFAFCKSGFAQSAKT